MAKRSIPENHIGHKFGRLTMTVIVGTRYTPNGTKRTIAKFSCECGGQKDLQVNDVVNGAIKSCGCLAQESRRLVTRKHGHCSDFKLSPEWRAWRDMLTRATNPNINHAKFYVGRNIGVCLEWNYGGDGNGFERFLNHIGSKPSPKHSVDRICNDRGYEPGNVRWATAVQQARNKTSNRIITWNEKSMCLTEACTIVGLRFNAVRDRLDKLGWSLEKALTTPLRPDRRRSQV